MITNYCALKEEREIIHSKSFRRLKGKTQVCPYINQNIHITERMSHSLEVGVNARIILNLFQEKLNYNLPINSIQLNNICMLHDIGHPPLGHHFEKIAHKVLKKDSIYFEGNANNIKIVEKDNIKISDKTLTALIKYPKQISSQIKKGLYPSQYKKYIPILINEIKEQYELIKKTGQRSIIGDKFCKLLLNEKKSNKNIKLYKEILKKTKIRLIETIIMEEADDITYLTHDLKDYCMFILDSNEQLDIKTPTNKYIKMISDISNNNIDKVIMDIRDILLEDIYFDFDSYKIKYKTQDIEELKKFLYNFTMSKYIVNATYSINNIINLEKYLIFMMSKINDKKFIEQNIKSMHYKEALLNATTETTKKRLMINFIAEKTDEWLLEDYNIQKDFFLEISNFY